MDIPKKVENMILERTARGRKRPRASPDPFFTLTYAQSVDGSIGQRKSKNPLILSGKEAFKVTHELRRVHDFILVGVGTVLADDPSLTTRTSTPSATPQEHHPTPIILDPRVETPPSAKILSARARIAPKHVFHPCIVFASSTRGRSPEALSRAEALLATGLVEIVYVDSDAISLEDVSKELATRRREDGTGAAVMVEGGASVLSRSLATAADVVDCVVVTIGGSFIFGESLVKLTSMDVPVVRRELKLLACRPLENDVLCLYVMA